MLSKAEQWEKLRAELPEKYADEIVEAAKELHSVFDDRLVDWFAGLYDPETGGFYFSESARDTDGYLPDAESTGEMYYFLTATGMTGGRPYNEALPEFMKTKAANFIYNLQAPDGYYYHPQWGGEVGILRRSRDVGTCDNILKAYGVTPKYQSPISSSKNSENEGKIEIPERFQNFENYKKYIEKLDIPHRSYNACSELSSSWSEIVSYGKMVGEDYAGYTMELLDSLQREDNGLWHETVDYYGVNGVHKASFLYGGSRRIPHVDKALDSTISTILSDAPVGASVDVYNPWHVVAVLAANKKNAQGASSEEIEAFMDKIYSNAAAMIRKSAEKARVFKAPDGGISYTTYHNCPRAYGTPTAVPGVDEGDINGACCGSIDIVRYVYEALGVTQVPMYGEEDFERFLSIVNERESAWNASKNKS